MPRTECVVHSEFQVTSRDFLYHLPCEPSARKLKGLGGRWLPPEAAVWPDRVVVDAALFDDDLRFFQRVEQLSVEQLIPHLSVERFAVAMLPGGPRLDVQRANSDPR